MFHITDMKDGEIQGLKNEIFTNIKSGNTILFLGAGASVTTEKKYLSSQFMEYHKLETGNTFETNDITEYVDVLMRNPQFIRSKFDDIVEECLRNLHPDPFHLTIARLPWKEIITTNIDTIIEKAFDSLYGTSNFNKVLRVARNETEFHYIPSNDEVKLVKLNGCVSDRSKYPFVFSTRDFESTNRFYKIVLKSMEHMSPRIQFLVVGYSFEDPFAKQLLDRFDRYQFQNKRDIIRVEPTVQEEMLPYLSSKHIRIVRCSASDFLKQYEEWETANEDTVHKRQNYQFRKKNDSVVNLPSRLLKEPLINLVVRPGGMI